MGETCACGMTLLDGGPDTGHVCPAPASPPGEATATEPRGTETPLARTHPEVVASMARIAGREQELRDLQEVDALRAEIQRERAASDVWKRAAESQNRQWAKKCEQATELRARAESAEQRLREVEGARDEWISEADRWEKAYRTVGSERDSALSDLTALRERIGVLAKDAERQSKLNPPELGDPIAVAGPWAWARMAELLRGALSPSTAEPASGAGAGNPDALAPPGGKP